MEVYLSSPCIPLWDGLGQFVSTFCKLCLVTGLKAGYFDDIWSFGLELYGLWLELVLGCFEPLSSMMGRGSLSTWTNHNISGRIASWCWLLVWVVWIAACTETFLEHVTPCLSVSNGVELTKHDSYLFLCLFVCLSQIYRLWCLIIISVATYPVLRAVRPAIASVPILANIQGVPETVDSHAYFARWEFVYA